MNNITKLTDSIKTHINEADKTYIKRHNKDGSNKLNFNKALYSSIKMLHKSGASQVRNDLDCDDIVDISKNALIKNTKSAKT